MIIASQKYTNGFICGKFFSIFLFIFHFSENSKTKKSNSRNFLRINSFLWPNLFYGFSGKKYITWMKVLQRNQNCGDQLLISVHVLFLPLILSSRPLPAYSSDLLDYSDVWHARHHISKKYRKIKNLFQTPS